MTASDLRHFSRDNALVDNGAAARKSCLSPLGMRKTTGAGGLPPTGETATAIWTTLDQPPFRLCSTEETNSKDTSTRSVSYDSSLVWLNFLLAASSCRRVIVNKLGQSMMFDPGGFRSSPRLPVFGNVTRVILWGDLLFFQMWVVVICSG